MKTYGVIMAGGGGTRFWPLSRQNTPKQLLNLTGNDVMINEAVERLTYVTDKSNIFIVTNACQVDSMEKVTKGRIADGHILSEPSARNTTACIGYAATEIVKKYEDGVMVITPSDHYIKDTASFIRVLNKAINVVENQDKIVTIGISPTYPATGFGYIKFKKTVEDEAELVQEYKEKPDFDKAKEYVDSGLYVWNSGMFICKASTILKKMEELVPDIYNDFIKIGNAMNTEQESKVIEEVYPMLRKISIDYAIMEPSAVKGDVLVLQGDFGWNDVGSWDMMDVLNEADADGNVTIGDTITINTTNTVVYSSSKLVTTVGVDNLVIVETDDAVMVCAKDKAQDVKLIVDELIHSGKNEKV